jgi:hypothetical protein
MVLMMAAPAMAVLPNFEGWEDPNWVQDTTRAATWRNATRVTSGSDGITSYNGVAHAHIMFTDLWPGSGPWSAGTFHGGPMTGTWQDCTVQLAMYIDMSDPNITDGQWSFEIDQAISSTMGSYAQGCIIHGGNDPNTDTVVFAQDGNSYGYPDGYVGGVWLRGAKPHYEASATGWYVLEWDLYDDGTGALYCDSGVYDPSGTYHNLTTWGIGNTSNRAGHAQQWTCSIHGMDYLIVDDSQVFGVIPEPASLALLGLGGLALLRRRR